MPIWAPIIIGALGAAAAAYFQDREWRHEREHLRAQRYAETASKVQMDISKAAHERLFRLRELGARLRDGAADRAQVGEAWRAHLAAKEAWEAELGHHLTQAELCFGAPTRWLIAREDHPAPGQRSGLAARLSELDARASDSFHCHGQEPERFGGEWQEAWERLEREIGQEIEALSKVMTEEIQRGMLAPPAWSLIQG